MSILKIKSDSIDVELVLDGASVDMPATVPSANDEEQLHVALIALAINQMLSESASHDWDPDCITIQPRTTEWTSKTFSFTNNKL